MITAEDRLRMELHGRGGLSTHSRRIGANGMTRIVSLGGEIRSLSQSRKGTDAYQFAPINIHPSATLRPPGVDKRSAGLTSRQGKAVQ